MTTLAPRYRLPLDLTGKHPTNKILKEEHTPDSLHRLILLREGAFYNDSVEIYDRGRKLSYPQDYTFSRIDDEAVKLTGQAVSRIICIKNEEIPGSVYVTYQAVGERFMDHNDTFLRLMKEALADLRGTHWKDIIDKPEAHMPLRHLHHIHDVYGLGPIFAGFLELSKTLQHLRISEDRKVWMEMLKLSEKVDAITAFDPSGGR